MTAPARQTGFRRLVVGHVALVAGLVWLTNTAPNQQRLEVVGNLILVLGIVEGAAIVGWRLTQIPKSQALEFLLTSPVQPRRVFVAEALVGAGRYALVWLSGLPLLVGLAVVGTVEPVDLLAMAVLPFAYGLTTGLMLTAWVYESAAVRRVGEILGLIGVMVYLVVGVLAGEHLLSWLNALPGWLREGLYNAIIFTTSYNPFGVVRYWFNRDDSFYVPWIARERMEVTFAFAVGLGLAAFVRASVRLKGHFHDRHYKPIDSRRKSELDRIGDRPLSWWAVRRVMEYSGRVNLWLAVGFSFVYAAYLIAGDDWPAWMGKAVFQLFEKWGGAPGIACALSVLAAVPAAFQFGLWDPTVQDRCRRLELLLLTDLTPGDYWHASITAAFRRGRGYFVGAGVLWVALGVSGSCAWTEVCGAAAGAAVLWAFSFAVGFRNFSTGSGGNGMASLMTLGLPLVMIGLLRSSFADAAAFVPTALCYLPVAPGGGITLAWVAGMAVIGTATLVIARYGLARCDGDLRRWLDANQGQMSPT